MLMDMLVENNQSTLGVGFKGGMHGNWHPPKTPERCKNVVSVVLSTHIVYPGLAGFGNLANSRNEAPRAFFLLAGGYEIIPRYSYPESGFPMPQLCHVAATDDLQGMKKRMWPLLLPGHSLQPALEVCHSNGGSIGSRGLYR